MADLFDTCWFKKTKLFARIMGQWPYQGKKTRFFIIVVYQILLASVVPQMMRAFYFIWLNTKLEAVVQCFPPLCTLLAVSVKYQHYTVNQSKTKLVFERIRDDWAMITEMGDRAPVVLEKYANIGRATVSFYATYIYLSLAIFLSLPVVLPAILDQVIPLNESRQARLLFPIDYGVDPVKYRYWFMFHEGCVATLVITVFVASESIYMPLVCHSCGLFAVVGDRLARATDTELLETVRQTDIVLGNYDKNMKSVYKSSVEESVLVTCMKLHDRAFWFASYLETYYSTSIFALVSLNMMLVSVTGVQIIMTVGDWEECITAVVYCAAQLVHLFFLSLPGELLLNTSEGVRDSVYSMPWYNLPPNLQQLLVLIIMRSTKPCRISAGSFFVLKMETFSSVVQTSMSYLTVLASFY